MIEPLRKAHEAGIAVVCVDTFIGTGVFQTGAGDADFPICYVASDNVLGGRMAARALAKAIGEKGKVYVSNVKPGISTTDQREEGFKAEIAQWKDIEVLDTQFNDDDANKAASQFQAVLGRVPDLAGVFGASLFSAGGASNGAKQAGVAGKVKMAGFDAPESIVAQLKDGTFELTIAQHPAEIGYFGLAAAHAYVTGNPVPTAIGTGFTVMTAANRAGINVKRLTITIYIPLGVMAGIAGVLYTGRFSAGAPQAGEPLLLLSIAVIDYGLVLVDVEPFWQFIAVGLVIIVSVLVDQAQRRFTGGRQVE